MALGNIMHGVGGIGQQADALRDGGMSPQQLQQRYQKSAQEGRPDIATLLALNAVMEEVKAKEAEMRLAMKPEKPGTILEQRDQELKALTVGQNTSEKAEQVGGIAQLQQKQQQQNIQRMAQGPQGAPQMALQGAPQMAAHGGIIMQDAPNLQHMAGGGIVGFANGSEVTDDFGPLGKHIVTQKMIDAYRARLGSRQRALLSDADIMVKLRDDPSLLAPPKPIFPGGIRRADDTYDPEVIRQKKIQAAAGADYDRMQRERLEAGPLVGGIGAQPQVPPPQLVGGVPPAVSSNVPPPCSACCTF